MDMETTDGVKGLLKSAEKQVDAGRRSLHDLAPNTAPCTFTILLFIDHPQWVALKKIKIRCDVIYYVGKYIC